MGTYFDYMMMEWQGKERELTSTLRLLISIDLNKFSGEIPPSMSQIASLSYLDMSHNNLSGRIRKFNDTKVEGTLNMSPLKLLELKSIVEYLSKFDEKSDASPLMLLEERFKCVSCEGHVFQN
ncbi:hypothetical protein OSB04_011209 [Centaurea solstitialis]|uniref:Uncharacterized protein n=1 Tax=Centaurea solstitialis TaxID=347529 RepID=A0AA38WLA9_9ASTR|nr:hypothetical protein OSB04_011209 [Centaurea solstitialis]